MSGIVADEEQCRRWGARSLGLATALNPYIGYEAAAEVAKEAYRTGKSVPDVVLEHGILTPMSWRSGSTRLRSPSRAGNLRLRKSRLLRGR